MIKYPIPLLLLMPLTLSLSFGGETRHQRKPLPDAATIAALPPDGGDEFNRLVFEQSPYLLQHARNPVDWHPWGPEAFEKAKKEDKPVFLSVGYSTCHWCHVMEHESFEDAEVAALMNAAFICIKVDREERPDIDSVYMNYTQSVTGRGGWPMTVVMTPDQKPFFAGTYFPKGGHPQRPGMMNLVPELSKAWKNERAKVNAISDKSAASMQQMNASLSGAAITKELLEQAYQELHRQFDSKYGGFSQAPKFPVPHNLLYLLRYYHRTGQAKALQMVETTLTQMRLGGIYDQVGFGFHRYSTDQVWLLPHFEKMLYDQALLALAYTEAYQITKKEFYKTTADEIFTYVLRDMTAPEGGFYSAEDADSDGVEGKFYVWTPEEIREILGDEDGNLFIKLFEIQEGGNFKDQGTGQQTGESIPHLKKPLAAWAQTLNIEPVALTAKLEAARKKLFDVREKRIHPYKDDKILTDWNGLMIAAFARASQVFNNPAYLQTAEKASAFILGKVSTPEGRLLKRYRQGQAGLPGHLEDYAFMVFGLIECYEASFDAKHLEAAKYLNDLMLKHFWDDANGACFLTADDGEKLIVRNKDIYDGAIPSGNSVAGHNLIRLARLTGQTDYEIKGVQIAESFSKFIHRAPTAAIFLMSGLEFSLHPSYEVLIAGNPKSDDTKAMLKVFHDHYLPNSVVLLQSDALRELVPYAADMKAINKKATAYVCQNFSCNLPTTDLEKMKKQLNLIPKNKAKGDKK